jgi:hypothetical protein
MLYVELTDLEPADQVRIKAFLRYRRHADSNYTTDHKWVGKRIWRPVDKVVWAGKLIKEPWDDLLIQDSLTRSERPVPVKILRAKQRRSDAEWIAKDADETGIICLCFDPVPADWTYFEIQKVHFLEKSLIVKPIVGDKQELLRMF